MEGFELNEESCVFLLRDLSGDDNEKLNALNIISILALENPDFSSSFPLRDLAQALANLLTNTRSDEIIIADLQCITSLITSSILIQLFFLSDDLFRQINTVLNTTESVDVASSCFRLVNLFSSDKPFIVNSLDVKPFHKFFDQLSPVDQRDLITMLSRLADGSTIKDMSSFLPFSIQMTNHSDQHIRKSASQLILSISGKMNLKKIPNDIFDKLIELLSTTQDFQLFQSIVQVLNKVVALNKMTQPPLHKLPNFEQALFGHNQSNSELTILTIIHDLLPTPNLPSVLWDKNEAHLSFLPSLVPQLNHILCRYLIEKNSNKEICLKTLSASSSIYEIHPSLALLNALLRFSHNIDEKSIPYLLALMNNIQPKRVIIRSGLLDSVSNFKVTNKKIKEWCKKTLAKIKSDCHHYKRTISNDFNSIHDIVRYIEQNKLFPFEFSQSGLLSKTLSLLQTNPRLEIPLRDVQTLTILGNGALDLLSIPALNVRTDYTFMKTQTIEFVAKNSCGGLYEISVPLLANFLMVEGWYNMKINENNHFLDFINSHEELKHLLQLDEDTLENQTLFALINRGFQTPEYKKCSFRINGEVYSAFDNIVMMMAKSFNNLKLLASGQFEIEIIEEDIPFYSQIEMNIGLELDSDAFPYLKILHDRYPNDFLRNNELGSLCFQSLADQLTTLTFLSPHVQFMYLVPFLFTFQQRSFVFMATSLDAATSAKFIRDKFYPEEKRKDSSISLKCVVSRDNLFQDGCTILDKFAAGPVHLDFIFKNENGVGEGPTQEFFTLMSRELCKRSNKKKLWRDDLLHPSDFVWNPNGLFPSVDADPEMLRVLGLLMGKAVIVGKILDLPLNPAFFDLICSKLVTVEQIDPQLSKSLKCKEGLFDLPFVYPGTNVKMVENGDTIFVNDDNVDYYITLIKSFTCGDNMKEILKPFIDGFQTNLRINSLNLLSSDEISTILCGHKVAITKSQLKQYSIVEHGYNKDDIEIQNLFDIISEMDSDEQELFVKFVTGCNRLPYGGISALKPPFTIAKRIDEENQVNECLPTVMTCTNYFKLPPYSSKEIMKEKIEKAIHECQNAFELS